jgi:hypothetical protein
VDSPVKIAFCPILFTANGGKFDELGRPLFEDGVRALCDRPYDCLSCSYMQQQIQSLYADGWTLITWECFKCIEVTKYRDKFNPETRMFEPVGLPMEVRLPGFFQEGRAYDATNRPDYSNEIPYLTGCTRCGVESSFLQLVLRKPLKVEEPDE